MPTTASTNECGLAIPRRPRRRINHPTMRTMMFIHLESRPRAVIDYYFCDVSASVRGQLERFVERKKSPTISAKPVELGPADWCSTGYQPRRGTNGTGGGCWKVSSLNNVESSA